MKGIWDEILEQEANAKDKPDTTPIVDLIGPAEQPFDSPLTPELGQGTTSRDGGCPLCQKCGWHIIKGLCGCRMSLGLQELLWG